MDGKWIDGKWIEWMWKVARFRISHLFKHVHLCMCVRVRLHSRSCEVKFVQERGVAIEVVRGCEVRFSTSSQLANEC